MCVVLFISFDPTHVIRLDVISMSKQRRDAVSMSIRPQFDDMCLL